MCKKEVVGEEISRAFPVPFKQKKWSQTSNQVIKRNVAKFSRGAGFSVKTLEEINFSLQQCPLIS